MKDAIHTTKTSLENTSWTIKIVFIWAFLLTVMALYNFNHNLTDKENAIRYESSISEHNKFKANDEYFKGAIDTLATERGCPAPSPKPQSQE